MSKSLLSFFLAILCTLSYNATASHIAGGEITYKWIGNSNFPNRYEVTLTLIRDSRSTATIPTNPSISYSSYSCGSGGSFNAIIQPGSGISVKQWAINNNVPGPFDCVDVPSNFQDIYEIYIYKDTVNLPGVCADWTFSYSLCCRNPAIANLVNPAGNRFYIDALLNNTIGSNSSPVFIDAPLKAFCTGGVSGLSQPHIWRQRSIETDGDSIHYRFGWPKDDINTNIPFAPGFTVIQPILTTTGISFLSAKKGVLQFTPNAPAPEDNVVKLDIEEFRMDPNNGLWQLIGRVSREITVPIVSQCGTLAGGLSLDLNHPAQSSGSIRADNLFNIYGIDTTFISKTGNPSSFDSNGNLVYTVPIVDYNDFDSVIHLVFANNYECRSLSPDGTEFRLIGPDSNAYPIIGTYSLKCDTNGAVQDEMSNEIYLLLTKSLNAKGFFVLQFRKGTDGDVLTNHCSAQIESGYTILIKVDQVISEDEIHSQNSQFITYPNPSHGSFTIEFQKGQFKPYRLKVLNNVGKELYSKEIQNKKSIIDLDLAGGYYILQAEMEDRSEVHKILIVK